MTSYDKLSDYERAMNEWIKLNVGYIGWGFTGIIGLKADYEPGNKASMNVSRSFCESCYLRFGIYVTTCYKKGHKVMDHDDVKYV